MQESDRILKIKKQFFLIAVLLEKNCPRGPSIFLEKNQFFLKKIAFFFKKITQKP